ncbi:hypothetical protein [Paenibacillus durus]|uniref:Uncharacterized protein n=1 Tax=Paenibacillus durus TaxID=44251 RepID=A0A089J1H7_PAEDU|nr:hypothetical protein [Paenibacillus durus]AIQ15039.1 hypothetical protein PDUR_26565 [Paenibacillus durus]
MLKKLLTTGSLLMLALFLFSSAVFASQVAASQVADNLTKDQQKALKIIDIANKKIDNKIEKAVAEADKLQEDYLRDIKRIELGKAAAKLSAKLDQEDAEAAAEVAEIQAASNELINQLFTPESRDSAVVEEKINKLNEKVSLNDDLISARTKVYTYELDKLITDLYNDTLEIADAAISEAAQLGVVAERSWKLVKIADREVWIDPIVVSL